MFSVTNFDTMCHNANDISESFSGEPTKTDVDVLNALADVDLDAAQYPNICRWRAAMQTFTIGDRNT